ncbi:hypothetical protein [Thiospirillum jenense]|uniref:Uncharacterized protein n=1 Tax=Thiospirillum jenense TaxID=1653858 RepID=A0A839HKL8_9GAMM|nr:hypothetical protein [Thiospirillum jenense]MBB1126999.1 hypothetical protein [Thiospirillum jenense]
MKSKLFLSLNAVATATILTVTFGHSAAVANTVCKELQKEQCETTVGCSYVDGYVRKDGIQVKAHCRNKPGYKKAMEEKQAEPAPPAVKPDAIPPKK